MADPKPTKPLFTARFTLVNTSAYSPDAVLKAFKSALTKAGWIVYQTPAIRHYTAKYKITKEGPFPDDDSKAVYENMEIEGPAGKPLATSMDIVNDPKGSRPILEQRKPIVTAITWNLGPPKGGTPQALSDFLWATRKAVLYNDEKFTGIGWVPVVAEWGKTPVKLTPYPDRPALPAVLQPAKPVKPVKPKPVEPVKPKPVVIVKPPAPPPPPPPPPPAPVAPTRWPLYTGLGLAAWLFFGKD